jgi:hypothetical protein
MGLGGVEIVVDLKCPGDNSSREVGMGNPAEGATITRTLNSLWKWRLVSSPARSNSWHGVLGF